jgi:hypothetical protein
MPAEEKTPSEDQPQFPEELWWSNYMDCEDAIKRAIRGFVQVLVRHHRYLTGDLF